MEAIGELIAAIVGLAGALLELLLLSLELLFFAGEFLITLLVKGLQPARQRFRSRRLAQASRAEAREKSVLHVLTAHWIVLAIIVATPVAIFSVLGLISRYHESQITQTTAVASKTADKYFAQLKANPDATLPVGPLEEVDIWNRPLKLSVQRSMFGYGVEVASDGPDQNPGGHDDIVVSRFQKTEWKEAGANMAERGKNAIQDWWQGKPEEDSAPSDEVKIEEEFENGKFSIKFGTKKD